MHLNLPGLWVETLPSGSKRYRVRVEGKKWQKIKLQVPPEHPAFMEHYRAARAGIALQAEAKPIMAAIPRSVAWLTYAFEEAMDDRVANGLLQDRTAHQRKAFYARLRKEYGDKAMAMPQTAVSNLRDKMASTPGAADNMVKAIRALYAWAVEKGHVSANPAEGIGKINRGKGATPWSIDDLKAYREAHQIGTQAHLALTLLMFTACRISDLMLLGPRHERTIQGIRHLDWIPAKKGSARVIIPMLPPLTKAIEAQNVVHPDTYLLTAHGRPFSSTNALDNRFRKWVSAAGLSDRSSHGVRKAAGELLALEGATQYHIMAVHGHTQAKTSEVYTSGVNRQRLAHEAMKMLAGMEW